MFFACDRTKKSFNEGLLVFQSGVPEGTRTPDRALRRRMLYPAELPGHCFLPRFERSIIISKTIEECKRFWHILLPPPRLEGCETGTTECLGAKREPLNLFMIFPDFREKNAKNGYGRPLSEHSLKNTHFHRWRNR